MGFWKTTIHLTLHHNLNLSTKPVQWFLKLLTEDIKKERVRSSEELLAMVRRNFMEILDDIIIMDESVMSFHTPETQQQSRQWLP
jgi:hypothetical protein